MAAILVVLSISIGIPLYIIELLSGSYPSNVYLIVEFFKANIDILVVWLNIPPTGVF